MLNEIINSLKGSAGNELVEKFGLSNESADGVFGALGDSATEIIGNQITSGGLDNVMNLFSDQPNNSFANSIVEQLGGNFFMKLTNKLGLSDGTARAVQNFVLPMLVNLITQKNNETPFDDASSILDMFGGGGKTGLLAGLAKKFFK
ncbi:hypothetical protein QQ008_24030 [Fulvivirgaceae bacterium BMA10]|uniref:DUF937 domain-containing protein n=1 Tax=Splendidivirga corallicola TaxID=3051826 RepID=A0ABT8KUN1_9BACT|nr:hypothetical protein [Fulvivirgaceae bacterium BMA10]